MTKARPVKIKILLSDLLFLVFTVFCVVAFLGPTWGTQYAPTEYRRGLDIVFAIDVSRSMDIRDALAENSLGMTKSRLERGLEIAKHGILTVSGARFAAAIGRSRGYLSVPLTFDSETALLFLDSLDTSSMTGRSTNLEALIETAADAFLETSPARKVIVLVSDGESHAGIFRNAVNRCVRDGIIINTVAVGSDEGRQILSNPNFPESELVISSRDSAVMRSAAERTGGIFIDGSREDAARDLSSHLLSLAQETERRSARQAPKQQRTFFIILALLSLGASKFVTRQLPRARTIQVVALIALSVVFSSCTEGRLLLLEANYLNSRSRHDEALVPYLRALDHEEAAPYAEYGLGYAFYNLDEGEAALARYRDSLKLLERFPQDEHRELRYRNHYNLGIIHFEKGEYNLAVESFRDALRSDPRRIDAKRNLELSLLSISIQSRQETGQNNRQEQREILFDYLREEEQQLWKSREWTMEENYTGPDY